MKTLIVLLMVIAGGIYNNLYSLDTAAVKYYPLAVGNTWTYSHFATNGPAYRYREKITGTIVTNGHLYYIFTYYRIGFAEEVSYRRIDSVKNNVLVYSSNSGCLWLQNEETADSLGARKGDSSLVSCVYYYRADTISKSLFGSPRKTKKYSWSNYFEAGATRELTRDFGFTYEYSFAHTNQSYNTLIGCIINGVMYGDTSLVGVTPISTEIPVHYELYQNYPNPFNPVTKIKFQIPLLSGVTDGRGALIQITIYDALGREIVVLVNQQLQPGTYEADWDASAYPSGVYYYLMEVRYDGFAIGNFTETRKMILIR